MVYTTLFSKAFYQTIESEIEKKDSKKVQSRIKTQLSKLEMGYEERLIIFKNLIKHRKNNSEAIYLKDVHFWFPECKNKELYGSTQIPNTILEKGLEVFLAELIEHKESLEPSSLTQ